MKKTAILILSIILIPVFGFTQNLENLDFVSPFNEGLAAVKSGDDWAFIDEKGTIVIDFRDDLVATKIDDKSYPLFKNARCKIKQEKEGISYFGFIDTNGNTVIEPKLLNAKNFDNGSAIVLLLEKDTVGSNKLLKKPVVSYDYFEVLIDTKGNVLHYIIEKPMHITLSKDFLKKPPKIRSKMLSNNVFAIRNNNRKWSLKKVTN